MEILFKVIGISFIAIICYAILKTTQPQISSLLLVVSGILILIILSDSILSIIGFFEEMTAKAGIGKNVFATLIKIVGVGYLTEYSVSLCEDNGCASLSKKIELGGKIAVLISSIPIITQIISMIEEML